MCASESVTDPAPPGSPAGLPPLGRNPHWVSQADVMGVPLPGMRAKSWGKQCGTGIPLLLRGPLDPDLSPLPPASPRLLLYICTGLSSSASSGVLSDSCLILVVMMMWPWEEVPSGPEVLWPHGRTKLP